MSRTAPRTASTPLTPEVLMPNPDDVAGYQDVLTGSHDAPPPDAGAVEVAVAVTSVDAD